MERLGFQDNGARLIDDAIAEVQAHTFGGRYPDLDGQHVVVPRRGLIAQAAFQHRKDGAALLPLQKRGALGAEEFAAGGFEQIQITGVVNVIADGAFGVSHAMRILENGHGAKSKA